MRFVLPQPSRRAYAHLDSYEEDYNLARMVRSAKTRELREFLGPIERELIE